MCDASYSVGEIRSQDFDRNKVAYFGDDLTLADGTYDVCYTFTQSGSNGRQSKQAQICDRVVVSCSDEPNECPTAAFFGNIQQPQNLCKANGTPNVNIHLKTAATGAVTLWVSGPGTAFSTDMERSGESCVYQYRWVATDARGVSGTYTFTAKTETGETLATKDVTFTCD